MSAMELSGTHAQYWSGLFFQELSFPNVNKFLIPVDLP